MHPHDMNEMGIEDLQGPNNNHHNLHQQQEEEDNMDEMDCDQIGEENQDYGYEMGLEDADDEAERLQAEETVLNNHLECVK